MSEWAIVSNLFFLIPAARAFVLKLYTETVVLLIITTVSLIYHACDHSAGVCPGAGIGFWRPFDDLVALYTFVVVTVFLLALAQSQAKSIAYIVGGLVVYLARGIGDDFHVIAAILIGFVLALILRLALDWRSYPYRDLDLLDLAASALLGIAGLAIYVLQEKQETTEQMRMWHGFWHVMLALSVYFALESLSHDRTLLFWRRTKRPPTLDDILKHVN